MGKSQRYQAAVDGHYAALHHWIFSEKMQGMMASRAGIRADTFIREALGGACWLVLLCSIPLFQGDFFYGGSAYELQGGEEIVWYDTCTGLGTDVGAERKDFK